MPLQTDVSQVKAFLLLLATWKTGLWNYIVSLHEYSHIWACKYQNLTFQAYLYYTSFPIYSTLH